MTVISVEHLSKSYRLGQIGTGTLTNDLKVWWAKARGRPNPLLKVGQQDRSARPSSPGPSSTKNDAPSDGGLRGQRRTMNELPSATKDETTTDVGRRRTKDEGPGRDGDIVWALKDVTFEVKQGEVLGIIGRNGAGKSTILKILSRITAPTEGEAKVKGRIASLLEVGTGFHPELTGRENIYLNGAVLGMKRVEIGRRFDEIAAFSGVEQFIDTPVKRYSSGMYVRLAFAVAAHLEPEILLVDEVLAVGDATFQKKCIGKMEDVAKGGRTVLFVSHNMPAVRSLCHRAMLIDEGTIQHDSEAADVIDVYLSCSDELMRKTPLGLRTDRGGSGALRLQEARLLDGSGQEVSAVKSGESVTVVLGFVNSDPGGRGVFRLAFENSSGQRLFMCLSRSSHAAALELPARGRLECRIPRLPLLPGSYRLGVKCLVNEVLADAVGDALAVDVIAGDFFGTGKSSPSDGGDMLVPHSWRVVPADVGRSPSHTVAADSGRVDV